MIYYIGKAIAYSNEIIQGIPNDPNSKEINHNYSTEAGNSGCPIILYNSKFIRVHREAILQN